MSANFNQVLPTVSTGGNAVETEMGDEVNENENLVPRGIPLNAEDSLYKPSFDSPRNNTLTIKKKKVVE